jgi:uncharacterized protein
MSNMRKPDRLISDQKSIKILEEGTFGILATIDEALYPYAVPLSYVYLGDSIYFHGTSAGGSKYDNLKLNNKVCFTVVGNTEVLSDKFGTLYESTMAFGTAELVTDESERHMVFREFVKKYSTDFIEVGEKYIKEFGPKAMVIRIKIDKITGKHRV